MQPPPAERILIIRPSALGDVCRSVPVLNSLRAAYPHARIDWVVQDTFAASIEAQPGLSNVIVFPRSRFGRWYASAGASRELMRWFGDIRRQAYDIAIDCQGLVRSGLIAFASGARIRIGLAEAREGAWLAYTQRVPRDETNGAPNHAVDRMLALVEAIGVEPVRDMRLCAPAADERWWALQRDALDCRGRYAVLAPTARWLSKRWPIERFAALVPLLVERGFDRVVIVGAASERPQVQPLLETARDAVIDLVGQTTVGQTLPVIAGAGLVVANDSAPLHMAVGFDRPCVGLFGPTDPAVVGPYRRPGSVVHSAAASNPQASKSPNRSHYRDPKLGDELMRAISVEAVLAAIDDELAREASGAAVAEARA